MSGTEPTNALPPCLLAYDFSTYPAPLATSTWSAAATGRINASAASRPNPVYCAELVILVPIGPAATDLSTSTPTGTVNTPRWALSDMRIVDGPSVGLGVGELAQFTFDARDSSDYLIDYSLVVSLAATVNSTPGTFEYTVRELSGTDKDNLERRQSTFQLEKQPPQFYLENLVATAPDAPTVPRAAFANAAPVRLSWESNGTWFQLYTAGVATPIYAGPATTYTVAGGMARDTTFVLVASVTGNPSGDGPPNGYATIYLYDSLTLGVSDPDLVPKSVTATGLVHGQAVTAETVNATTQATTLDLGVTGTTKLKDLDATGTTTLAGTTISGTLGVTQHTTLASTTVNALLQAGNASIEVMHGPYQLPKLNAWYAAPTDGYVVGWGSNKDHDLAFMISASASNITVNALAGRIMVCNPMSYFDGSCSLVLPVAKDVRFAVYGPTDRLVAFWWVPLGLGTPVVVGDAEPLAEPEPGPEAGWSFLDGLAQLLEEADGDRADRLRRALSGLLDRA